VGSRDESSRASRHDDEVKGLTAQISFLDEEIAALRRRLADSPRQARLLEERLRETEASLAAVTAQNERLTGTLREARTRSSRSRRKSTGWHSRHPASASS